MHGAIAECHGWQAVYVHVAWIPAIPAGMTVSCSHLCIKTSAGVWELLTFVSLVLFVDKLLVKPLVYVRE